MVTSRLDDTYAGSLLPAIRQVNEVLPPASDGRSSGRKYALSTRTVPQRAPAQINHSGEPGTLTYYDRVSARHSIGPQIYVEKGTYIDTWA